MGLDSFVPVGIDFGGAPLRQNFAHSLAGVRAAGGAAGIDPAAFARITWA